jgi:hypothetical protein
MSTLNEKLAELEAALTTARRRKVYRLVQAIVLVLVLRKALSADDAAGYLQALALALGIAPAELAARNAKD